MKSWSGVWISVFFSGTAFICMGTMIAYSWYCEKFWAIDCPLTPTYSLQWMISKFTVLPKGVSRGGGTWFLILGNFIWCYLLFMFSLLHLMLYSLTTCKKILIYDHHHPHSVLFHQLVPPHPLENNFHHLNLMMESQLCLRHLPCIINLRFMIHGDPQSWCVFSNQPMRKGRCN